MTAPTLPHPGTLPGAVPGAAAFGSAAAGARALARRATTPRALVLFLAAFLVINFARAHEMVRVLLPLRLGKLTGYPLLLLLVFAMPRSQLRAAFRTWPARGMAAIGALMVLGVPFSIWQGNSFGYVTGAGLISYIMFTSVAAGLIDPRARLVVLRTVTLAVAAGATRMLLPGAPAYLGDGAPRYLFGYTYDPNDTAALFLIGTPLAIYFGSRRGAQRLLWYAAALVMVVSLVRTGSRGGLVGLVAMLIALVLFAPPRQRARLSAAGLVAALVFGGMVQANPDLRRRIASVFASSEEQQQEDYNFTAANGRVEIWKRGVHYMITHPLLGVGIANFGVAELQIGSVLKAQKGISDRHMTTAHNSFVQIGAELGVTGFLAFTGVVATTGAGLWRVRRRASAAPNSDQNSADDAALASAVLTSLVGGMSASMFLSLAYSPMTVFTFGLGVAIIAGSTYRQGPQLGPVLHDARPPAAVRRRGMRGGGALAT